MKLNDLKLVELTLADIGPFRNGQRTFSLMGETAPLDSDPETTPGPSNLYMLLAPNGQGKTTVMEAIHGLFGLMGKPIVGRFADVGAGGKAQLDIRASWEVEGVSQTVLLSLWTGSQEPLRFWTPDEIDADAQAEHWAQLGLAAGEGGAIVLPESNELGRLLYDAVLEGIGATPTALIGEPQLLPTVLYFPADRSLVAPSGERVVAEPEDWGYSPAHRFGHDGPEWRTTIDSLLVWLEWLDDGSIQPFLDRLNRHVFEKGAQKSIQPPRRSELMSYVTSPNGTHPTSGLSHGERALVQMFGRIFSYRTANTIVLVDEIELHLHTRWMLRMYRELKALLVESPGVSLIFSTHDRELITAFDYAKPEPGLTKGGFLIDEMN